MNKNLKENDQPVDPPYKHEPATPKMRAQWDKNWKERERKGKLAPKIDYGENPDRRGSEKEQVGADVVAGENMGNDSAQTPMDDIVKFVLRKVPELSSKPEKVARVASLLFQHQFGGQQPPDEETLMSIWYIST